MKEFNKLRYVPGYDNGGDPLIGYSEGMVDRKQKIQMLEHKLKLAVQDLEQNFYEAVEVRAAMAADYARIQEQAREIRVLRGMLEQKDVSPCEIYVRLDEAVEEGL